MAEITPRRTGELLRGVFELLLDSEDGLQASEALRQLAGLVPPTPFENTMYPKHPDTRRYERIVRFSTIGPVKAGWLVKNKGRWSLTEDGRAAYATFTDPEAFSHEAHRL
jgi:restriction system protein